MKRLPMLAVQSIAEEILDLKRERGWKNSGWDWSPRVEKLTPKVVDAPKGHRSAPLLRQVCLRWAKPGRITLSSIWKQLEHLHSRGHEWKGVDLKTKFDRSLQKDFVLIGRQ